MKRPRLSPFGRLIVKAAGISAAVLVLAASALLAAVPKFNPAAVRDAASAGSSVSGMTNRVPLRNLTVHVLDVGQGDSILIDSDGSTMLIDAGIPEMGARVKSYLKSCGIARINVLVGTHPDSDHIGGMPVILRNFSVGTLIFPHVQSNTDAFERFVDAIRTAGLRITAPTPGLTFRLGKSVCTVLAPVESAYADDNDMSVVIRLTYGMRTFLFAGDAGSASEADMLREGRSLRADVLKVGHHGSETSTTDAFLKAVAPEYAAISVGAGNSYGLPAASTLQKLANAGVQAYCTDRDGTVVFSCDGKNIRVTTEKSG